MMVLLMSIGMMASAQEKKNKNARYDIPVNGNCEQCEKRIEKAALSVSGVKSAEWQADDQTLRVIINETKCSADDVKKAVAGVGHDAGDVRAPDEVYNNLHHCCKYDRVEAEKK